MHSEQEHLIPIVGRLKSMPPVPNTWGGKVEIQESSAAAHPCLWLTARVPETPNMPDGAVTETCAHLTAENAWALAEQIMWLVAHHYQGDATPEWATR